jgi:ABC-type transporter Mla subunit MlaD
MPLQDLTPQLRTRLSRLERVVGVFIMLATLLLVAGLAYYIYQRAISKGWGKRRLPYFTFVHNAAGIKVGQPIKLMGFEAGTVTDIQPEAPGAFFNVFVALEVVEPYDGYLWEDSRAKVAASDFLGNRFIELTKGTNGPATYIFHPLKEVTLAEAPNLLGAGEHCFAEEIYDQFKTNLVAKAGARFTAEALSNVVFAASVTSVRLYDKSVTSKRATGVWDFEDARYLPPDLNAKTRKGFYLVPDESPALTERLEEVVNLVEAALPNVLALTNRLQLVLDNAVTATAHADELLANARPIVANLTQISESLRDPNGSLGQWLIPPNLGLQLTQALVSANSLLTNSDAQLTTLAAGLDQTIENLAKITGNLHEQVRANTNLVGSISKLIIDTDDMVQGLKRHWLLRSAFKGKSAAPPATTRPPARSPRDGGR